ncbi:SRPBCC family protein [Heyndrickxia oleronia]|uniref:SRPBCC family protein n=1 Tax=Heyndrickxia oleronia TaxID=38875 RepID=UPI003337C278
MPIIKYSIYIEAPITICFDYARSVEVHMKTTRKTSERAIGGVTTGLLENGDIVVWEAIHFGIKQTLTAKIIEMDKPHKFIDIMVKGAFHSFIHTHEFVEEGKGTIMMDTFDYQSPFGILGSIADRLFLEKYMQCFLEDRAKELKRIIEKK